MCMGIFYFNFNILLHSQFSSFFNSTAVFIIKKNSLQKNILLILIISMQTPIENADDLSRQTEIKYGPIKSGSTENFFKVISPF